MPDAADSAPVLGRPFRSVRVRITLAAVVVTAVAMTAAGWLLVRSVRDTQLGRLQDGTEAYLDQVTERLEAGEDPTTAVLPTRAEMDGDTIDSEAIDGEAIDGDTALAGSTMAAPVFVQVLDDQGNTLAVHPTVPLGAGGTIAISMSAGTGGRSVTAVSGPPLSGRRSDTATGPGADVSGDGDGDGDGDGGGAGSGSVAPGGVGADDAELATRVRLLASDGIEQSVREVDTPSGPLTVHVGAPVDQVERSVDAVRRSLWMGLPLLVVAVALVAWYLVGRALRPVEAIRSEVAAIGGASMHRRVPAPDTDDEIGRLAHTMNAMLGRLEVASKQQRQFVSDASHELRSPVAAIRTDLEVALREGPDADWAVVASSVLAEEARLERLLDDLLVLASSDEAPYSGTDGPVDLAALLTDDAARARRVAVRFEAPDRDGEVDASVPGRAAALGRVVANLVDNAARHARSRVELSLVGARLPSGAPAVRVVVDDDGSGVPVTDRERVFERFTRLDEGRARDGGGAGLGLAVVRSIVTRHAGRVWTTDSPLGGARFVVELPASV